MPNTPESIDELGIPKITMQLSPLESIPTVVDPTLSNVGEAAEAKAVGEAIAHVQESIDGKNAETLYMDDTTQTPENTIAARIESLGNDIGELTATDIGYGENSNVGEALGNIEQDVRDVKDDLYATEIPVSATDNTPISEKLTSLQDGLDETVKVTDQTQILTPNQKLQARNNIGAASDAEVLKIGSQSIHPSIQPTIRENIGAIGESDLSNAFRELWLRRTYSFGFENLAAGATLTISKDDFGIEAIDGYEIMTFGRVYCPNTNITIRLWSSTGNAVVMGIRNTHASNAVSSTCSIDVIYIRSGMRGS